MRKPRMQYRNITDHKHPLANARGTLPYHRAVLFAKLGGAMGPHRCHWCGKTLYWQCDGQTTKDNLCVDHLDDDGMNNIPSNLVPSCHRCNCTRSRTNLVGDDEVFIYRKRDNSRCRAVLRNCRTCGKDFPFVPSDKRPNRGLYCSQRCMYDRNSKR